MITTANLYQSLGQNVALSWKLHNNYYAYYLYKVFHNSHNYQTRKTFNMTERWRKKKAASQFLSPEFKFKQYVEKCVDKYLSIVIAIKLFWQ